MTMEKTAMVTTTTMASTKSSARKSRLQALLVAALLAVCCLGLAACNGEGGVAATLNGEPIYEAQVTSYIQENRASAGLENDDAWVGYLQMMGMTPEQLRETTIMYFAQLMTTRQVAAEKGVDLSNAEVDAEIENMKAEAVQTVGGNANEGWITMLTQYGFNPDTFRDYTEYMLLYEKLCDQAFGGDPEAANAYLEEVFDTSDIQINDMPSGVPYNVNVY